MATPSSNFNQYTPPSPTIGWEHYYVVMLALVAWREARGEVAQYGEDAMRAVMCVVRNRVKLGWGDWDHVITKKWQFSSLTAPGDSQLTLWPDSPDLLFEKALVLADLIYNDISPDITQGATMYRNPATATSAGFQADVDSGKIKEVMSIGHHTFYK